MASCSSPVTSLINHMAVCHWWWSAHQWRRTPFSQGFLRAARAIRCEDGLGGYKLGLEGALVGG
eukprot:12244314-Prorocentrum_lima.AAC.1